MRNRLVVPVLLVLGLLLGACGGATSVDDVATAVEERGGYAAPGASLEQGEVEALARNVRNAGGVLGVVVLADEPTSGATAYAEDVLDRTTVDDVIVLTPAEIGAASAVVADLDAALDAASDGFGADGDPGAVAGFASQRYEASLDAVGLLAGAEAGVASPGEPPSRMPFLVVLVVLGGLGLLLVTRSRRRRETAAAAALEVARDEVREDLTVMADRILDLDDDVALADDEVRARWAQASEIYTEARDSVERLTDPRELRELDEDVELARWQLETIEAELRGTTPPPKPAPKPEPAPPPPPTPTPTSPPRTRPTTRLPEWAQEEVLTRQRSRRPSWGGGILGDVLGGVIGGAVSGASRPRGGRSWSTGSRSSSRGSTRSSSRSSSRSAGRTRSRGGRRK